MRSEPSKHVLILTPDVLSARMAGPAIRAYNMALHLSAEHDVRLLSLAHCDLQSDSFVSGIVTPGDIRELELWADVVILQGSVTRSFPSLLDSRKPIVVDLYDPFHLEALQSHAGGLIAKREQMVRRVTSVLNEQLRRGDLFLCATVRQRDLWLGHLAALGRVNPYVCDGDRHLEALLGVVPFGLPDGPPVKTRQAIRGQVPGIGESDRVLLWGGGIYPWLDPLVLIRAVAAVRGRVPNLRLFFLGLDHPLAGVDRTLARDAQALARELGVAGTHVIFNKGWVDFADRQNYLLDADIGVSTHSDHLETAFSFRTRILDYIWAGLPVLTTAGDTMAALVERERLGLTVPAADVGALADAVVRMLDDHALASSARANIARVAPQFTWSKVLRPLLEFCRNPVRARDLVSGSERDLMFGSEYRRLSQYTESLELANAHALSKPIRAILADRARSAVRRRPQLAAGLRPAVRSSRTIAGRFLGRNGLTGAVQAPGAVSAPSEAAVARNGARLLNIGSGQHPMDGWVNVDLPWDGVISPDVHGSVFALPFPDGVFDRVYMGHFLEHLRLQDEIGPALDEIRRVAKPGALVAAVGPCITRALEQERSLEILRAIIGAGIDGPGGHKWVPTSSLTVRVLESGGFRNVRTVPVAAVDKPEWPNPSTAGWQCAVLADVPPLGS